MEYLKKGMIRPAQEGKKSEAGRFQKSFIISVNPVTKPFWNTIRVLTGIPAENFELHNRKLMRHMKR